MSVILVIAFTGIVLYVASAFKVEWLESWQTGERRDSHDPSGVTGYLKTGGRTRKYYLHLPEVSRFTKPPLIVALHGGQGSAYRFARMTGLNALSDREGFAVVYPYSVKYWNDGRETTRSEVDDVAFIKALIDHLIELKNLDERRIYVTGASGGGIFTYQLACEMSDRIAACAPVIAAIPEALLKNCRPVQPMPMLIINGTEDSFIPWNGGKVRSGRHWGAGGRVASVPRSVAFWKKVNGCRLPAKVKTLPSSGGMESTRVTIMDFSPATPGAVVKFVKIEGGGHTWPGSSLKTRKMVERMLGNTCRSINASEMIWEFFRTCSRFSV